MARNAGHFPHLLTIDLRDQTGWLGLIAALTGFFVQRSKPWLVGVTMAFMILIVAATVVIASST